MKNSSSLLIKNSHYYIILLFLYKKFLRDKLTNLIHNRIFLSSNELKSSRALLVRNQLGLSLICLLKSEHKEQHLLSMLDHFAIPSLTDRQASEFAHKSQ